MRLGLEEIWSPHRRHSTSSDLVSLLNFLCSCLLFSFQYAQKYIVYFAVLVGATRSILSCSLNTSYWWRGTDWSSRDPSMPILDVRIPGIGLVFCTLFWHLVTSLSCLLIVVAEIGGGGVGKSFQPRHHPSFFNGKQVCWWCACKHHWNFKRHHSVTSHCLNGCPTM